MTREIVHPLLDSTLQQLTAIRAVIGDTAMATMIDAAKAQITSVKIMLGYEGVPQLPGPSAEATITGFDDREPPKYQMRLKMDAPKDKKRTSIGPTTDPSLWSRDNFQAAILILLRETERPMGHAEILQNCRVRRKEFGLEGKEPKIGARDSLRRLEAANRIRRATKQRPAKWVLCE